MALASSFEPDNSTHFAGIEFNFDLLKCDFPRFKGRSCLTTCKDIHGGLEAASKRPNGIDLGSEGQMVIIFCFTSHKLYDYHSKFLASKDIHIDSINRLLLAQILTASTNNFSKKPWHVGPRCVFIGGPRWVPMFRSVLPPRLSQ